VEETVRRVMLALATAMIASNPLATLGEAGLVRAAPATQQDRCVWTGINREEMLAAACPIRMGEVITDTIGTPGTIKVYKYRPAGRASVVGRVRMVLDDLPADYDLHLVTRDSKYLASSEHEGATPEVIELFGALGDNFFFVSSDPGRSAAPDQPFHLRAMLPSDGSSGAAGTYSLKFWALNDEDPLSGIDIALGSGVSGTTDETGTTTFNDLPTAATSYSMRNPRAEELYPDRLPTTALQGAEPGTTRAVLVLLEKRNFDVALSIEPDGRARLEWAPYDRADSYRILSECQSADGQYGRLKEDDDVTRETFFATQLQPGIYRWRVRAFSAIGRPLARKTVAGEFGPKPFCAAPPEG
jgi:hypothetical protein